MFLQHFSDLIIGRRCCFGQSVEVVMRAADEVESASFFDFLL
jgi:hypothetical protein